MDKAWPDVPHRCHQVGWNMGDVAVKDTMHHGQLHAHPCGGDWVHHSLMWSLISELTMWTLLWGCSSAFLPGSQQDGEQAISPWMTYSCLPPMPYASSV